LGKGNQLRVDQEDSILGTVAGGPQSDREKRTVQFEFILLPQREEAEQPGNAICGQQIETPD
jgi:hypothetical protein